MQVMAKILPIVLQPHPALTSKAEPVDSVTPKVLETLENMLETMWAADGIGLAAPQLDIRQRIVVLDLGDINAKGERDPSKRKPQFLINPKITWKSEEMNARQEGCLSFPGLWGEVERPAMIKFSYTDRDGQKLEREAEGLLATCVQHEIDHLDGVLFPQRMSRLRHEMMMKKWKRLREEIIAEGASFDTIAAEKGLIKAGDWRGR